MSEPISRRSFTSLSAGFVLGAAATLDAADVAPAPRNVRTEAPFERGYPATPTADPTPPPPSPPPSSPPA
jgi:hypothetical protein